MRIDQSFSLIWSPGTPGSRYEFCTLRGAGEHLLAVYAVYPTPGNDGLFTARGGCASAERLITSEAISIDEAKDICLADAHEVLDLPGPRRLVSVLDSCLAQAAANKAAEIKAYGSDPED